MGLATVYGIAQQAGGHISVSNIEGPHGMSMGAAFRIFLPAAGEAELAEVQPVEVKVKAPRDLSGAGRILFVEDEDAVRGIAARLLRQRGYEVIEAADGEEALMLAEEHAGQIDMMISDVIMPGLDGPSLLKKARKYLATPRSCSSRAMPRAIFRTCCRTRRGSPSCPSRWTSRPWRSGSSRSCTRAEPYRLGISSGDPIRRRGGRRRGSSHRDPDGR